MPSSGIQKPSSYVTGNTLLLCYRAQPVNAIRLEVFTAVTIMNAVFWDTKLQFAPRRTLRLRYTVQPVNAIRLEVFTAVTIMNAVFWDIKSQLAPRGKHITFPLQTPAS
jgi:hypothetical protein